MGTIPAGYDSAHTLKALGEIEADLRRLTTTLTEAQFHAPPPTGGWSVAHCIEHLVLTGQAFLPKWDAALKDTVNRHPGPFPYAWWQQKLLRFAEPPYRMKTKTTQAFEPVSRLPTEEEIRRFLHVHKEIERRIERCQGIDMARVKVQSPFASWIKYPLGFSFDLVLAHERRHLWQARQVQDQLPSG